MNLLKKRAGTGSCRRSFFGPEDHRSTDGLDEPFGVGDGYGREVSVVQADKEHVLRDVEEVAVGTDQNGDGSQARLRHDQAIIELVGGQKL